MTMTRVGVVGAGRVGAVLSAALRAAGHDVAAAAGEFKASRDRIAALLPGVPVDKPTAVRRSCELLLLTVPDDMLSNVVTMLAASGAIREGQYVAQTSGRHGLSVLQPAAAPPPPARRAARRPARPPRACPAPGGGAPPPRPPRGAAFVVTAAEPET